MAGKSETCELCGIYILDKSSLATHIEGKKHKRNVEKFTKQEEIRTKGIFVRGFPSWSSPEQLKRFFSQFGQIKEFFSGGTKSRFVIVQFMNRFSAEECLRRPVFFHGFLLKISQRKVNDDTFQKKAAVKEEAKQELNSAEVLSALPSHVSLEVQLATLMKDIQLSDTDKFADICQNLEATFSGTYPGCKAHPFGSIVTGLGFKGSDMDIYMDLNLGASAENTPEKQRSIINKAKKTLFKSRHLYSSIFGIPNAKTPIVTFVHKATGTSCDLSFKNGMGVQNSALIKYYLSLDERLKPLLVLIKYWTKKNELSGKGRLSHYALVLLVFFYLQQLSPPIIPTVYSIRSSNIVINGWECSFNPESWNPGHDRNPMTVPELVTNFFKFYSEFDYGLRVICPVIGQSLPKTLFETPEKLPVAMDQYKSAVSTGSNGLKVQTDMCVQDPYELTHNVTAGIPLKKLAEFKNYCMAAEAVCSQALSCQNSFLQKLFDKMKIPSNKSEQNMLCLDISFRKPPTCTILDEGELRQWWFGRILNILMKVFEQILKCDVKLDDTEQGESLSKIQRRDGQTDVSDIELNLQITEKETDEKKIYCHGKWCIWEGRKAASKSTEFAEIAEQDTLKREILLSELMVKNLERQIPASKFKFVCVFKCKQQPTLVKLEIVNQDSHKRDFNSMISFLQRHLPRWIDLGLNQPDFATK